MKTKIEWRLRAVTRYLLTRYESPLEPEEYGSVIGTSVQPSGEFDSLSLAITVGEAMAFKDRAARARSDEGLNMSDVTFDMTHLPHPKVRAKMKCSHKQAHRDSAWSADRDGGNVTLNAVYESGASDGGNAAIENRIFSKATPCALVTMQIDNPDAFSRFVTGQDYYVDFIPCPREDEVTMLEY